MIKQEERTTGVKKMAQGVFFDCRWLMGLVFFSGLSSMQKAKEKQKSTKKNRKAKYS